MAAIKENPSYGGDMKNSNILSTIAMTALRFIDKQTSVKSSDSNQNQLSVYTLSEVSNHDAPDDCWIILYDRVYDVTKLLRTHPGGDDIILEHAGRDATIAFRGSGHSASAINTLKQYEIGVLPDHQSIFRTNILIKLSDIPI